jgi:uncharacterized SAM-binding protein YcdF (DUF218 family)
MKKIILQLGGNVNRLDTGIQVLQQYPDATMIISSELPPEECINKLKSAKISKDRFIFDYQAWDTVTNFTTTLPIIRDMEIGEIYVVSDLFHIPRVQAICESVYLGRGIVKHYVAHGTDNHEEVVWYDLCRALLWRFTGFLLYDQKTKDERMPAYNDAAIRIKELLEHYEV